MDLLQHRDPDFHGRTLPCEGPLARACSALVAVDLREGPHQPQTVLPHGAVLLSVSLSAGPDPFAHAAERGLLPHLCRWRTESHRYTPRGGRRSFFALLTPEGAITLTRGQGLPSEPQPRQPLAVLMDRAPLVALEDALARTDDPLAQLHRFGSWLEDRLAAPARLPRQAMRAARIATELLAAPVPNVERLAAAEGLSRRQLERDFRRSFAVSPKRACQIARGQAAARLGFHGMRPADVAHELGFTDQSHLNRVTRQIFGVSPPVLARPARSAMGAAFRAATGGGLVYL